MTARSTNGGWEAFAESFLCVQLCAGWHDSQRCSRTQSRHARLRWIDLVRPPQTHVASTEIKGADGITACPSFRFCGCCALGASSAADRISHLHRTAGRVDDGAILFADSLFLH